MNTCPKRLKILWITSMVLPEHAMILGQKASELGGWLTGMLSEIRKNNSLEISIASTVSSKSHFSKEQSDNVVFYAIPCKNIKKYDYCAERYYKAIDQEWNPDIIHYHGSEFFHGLLAKKNIFKGESVLSIQGLINSCYPWCTGNLLDGECPFSLKDIILKRSFQNKKKEWGSRAEQERIIIKGIHAFCGRTDWDKMNIRFLNSKAKYFYVPEILRSDFYSNSGKWNINNIQKYSIFCNLSADPLKGGHLLLQACAILSKKYPIHIYALGPQYSKNMFFDHFVKSSYQLYINKLIEQYSLFDKITFLGTLNANGISELLKKSHLYVHPSFIENSSNAICEAQMVGCPVVAFDCGGNSSIIHSETSGLLAKHGDVFDLVSKIEQIFNNKELTTRMSKMSSMIALKRHNKKDAAQYLTKVYQILCK